MALRETVNEILEKYGNLVIFLAFAIVVIIVFMIVLLATRRGGDEPVQSTNGTVQNGTNQTVTPTNDNVVTLEPSDPSFDINPNPYGPTQDVTSDSGKGTSPDNYTTPPEYEFEQVVTDEWIQSVIARGDNVISEDFVDGSVSGQGVVTDEWIYNLITPPPTQ